MDRRHIHLARLGVAEVLRTLERDGAREVHREVLGLTVPPAPLEASPGPPSAVAPAPRAVSRLAVQDKHLALAAVREELGECTRCKLCHGRTHIVFGVGNPAADLVFVGEAPGRDEDLQAEPFVGRAGQLLTRMILAMGLRREDVYICNIIKCRPPNNRDPEPDEIQACEPFLLKQLEAIQPRVICALGAYAAQTWLRTTEKISRLRGKFHDYHGIKLLPTFHPAFLLRNQQMKRPAWEDLKMVMRELGLRPGSEP